MDSIVYKIDLDCRRSESQAKIEAKCGEASGRKIIFSLYEGRSPYVVPSGATAVFRAKKPSGAVLFNNCTITDDGNIEYVITTQTVAEVGIMPCELQLIQGGKVIFSPCFTMVVVNNLAVDSEVESSDEFTELVEALESIPSTDDLVKKSGDTMTGDLDMGDNAIRFGESGRMQALESEEIQITAQTGEGVIIGDGCIGNILNVENDTDAASKRYVDDVAEWVAADISDLDTRVTYLEEHGGGGGESYDDTELRQRIGAIEAKESTWDAKSNFSGSYNDLTDKPTIPEAVTDAHIYSLIDAKLGVIENGSY